MFKSSGNTAFVVGGYFIFFFSVRAAIYTDRRSPQIATGETAASKLAVVPMVAWLCV
jgi:hypothetical protein